MSIATSLEQSKRLLELGIDSKTADMFYYCQSEYDLRIGGYKAVDREFDIPSWSLSALLPLMPAGTQLLTSYDDSDCIVYTFAIAGLMDTMDYKNPIDAAVEMIEWLITNK